MFNGNYSVRQNETMVAIQGVAYQHLSQDANLTFTNLFNLYIILMKRHSASLNCKELLKNR